MRAFFAISSVVSAAVATLECIRLTGFMAMTPSRTVGAPLGMFAVYCYMPKSLAIIAAQRQFCFQVFFRWVVIVANEEPIFDNVINFLG